MYEADWLQALTEDMKFAASTDNRKEQIARNVVHHLLMEPVELQKVRQNMKPGTVICDQWVFMKSVVVPKNSKRARGKERTSAEKNKDLQDSLLRSELADRAARAEQVVEGM